MPFAKEHTARQLPRTGDEICVTANGGVTLFLGGGVVKCVRFDAAVWSSEDAKAWLRGCGFSDHAFEKAIAPVAENDGAKLCFKLASQDVDQGLTFGFAYIAQDGDDGTVVDHSGDYVDNERADDVKKFENAWYSYVEKSGIASVMHRTMGVSKVVEALFISPEKIAAMKDQTGKMPKLAAWVGFRSHDKAALEALRNGTLPELSIAGRWDSYPADPTAVAALSGGGK